jgi:hypothetical protein
MNLFPARRLDRVAERFLRLARQFNFGELAALMERDIQDELLPQLLLLMTMTDSTGGKALAVRLNRLRGMMQ